MSFLIRIDHERLPFAVIVDEDGRVAYAYLLYQEAIVGDVWLYNCVPAPSEPEWHDRSKAPFMNPAGYAKPWAVSITASEDIAVSWVEQTGELQRAEIYWQDQLLAVLAPGAKPGWSRNALKDGPLARVLSSDGL